MSGGSVLWRCEACGGPAKWCILGGAPHYICEQLCDGFMQMELDLRSKSSPEDHGECERDDPSREWEATGDRPDWDGLPF